MFRAADLKQQSVEPQGFVRWLEWLEGSDVIAIKKSFVRTLSSLATHNYSRATSSNDALRIHHTHAVYGSF